jgi:nitrogen fixation protein NifQ
MTPQAIYQLLHLANAATVCDPFDGHVLACILAASVSECHTGGSFTNALGVHGDALRELIDRYFPGTQEKLEPFGLDSVPIISEDERCLRELLWRFRAVPSRLNSLLSLLVAHRATRPNHLWQDLGLMNRGELSRLMQRHFVQLASRNTQDMKWKKFFYRMICREEGFSMCVAPSCSECGDFTYCFGDESGESLLARVRHGMETSKLTSIEGPMAL